MWKTNPTLGSWRTELIQEKSLPDPKKKGIERDFLGPRWGLREEEGKTWSDTHVQAYAMDEFAKNSQRSLGTPEQ